MQYGFYQSVICDVTTWKLQPGCYSVNTLLNGSVTLLAQHLSLMVWARVQGTYTEPSMTGTTPGTNRT